MIELRRRYSSAPSGGGGRLPAGYQEVEYLRSTGIQYMDIKYIPNQKTRLVMRYNHPANTNFGVGARKSTYEGFLYTTGGITGTEYGKLSFINGMNFTYATYSNDEIVKTLEVAPTSDNSIDFIYIDSIKIAEVVTENINNTYSMYIFGYNYTGTPYLKIGDIYSLSIDEDDTVIRELIPCYRKSDNVSGMYDLVSGEFYTNAGTGVFIVGPDVIG